LEAEFGFLCDATTIDREGKINALGIFDTLSGDKFPLKIFRMMLLISLVGKKSDGGDHDLEVKLLAPDGQDLIPAMQMKFGVPPEGGKARIVSELNNISFEKVGDYSFKVFVDKKAVTDIYLRVVQVPSPVSFIKEVPKKEAPKKGIKKGKSS